MQVVIVVGMVVILSLTAFVAGLSELECQRSGETTDCATTISPPPAMKSAEEGGFFTAAANLIGFLFSAIGYGISLTAAGFGFPPAIAAIIGVMLAVGITYLVLKLISLGGG